MDILKKFALVGIGIVSMMSLLAPWTFLPVPSLDHPKTEIRLPAVARDPERPLHQVTLPDFAAIKNIKQKKRAFFDFIRPAVVAENKALLALREKLLAIAHDWQQQHQLSAEQQLWLKQQADRFKVDTSLSEQAIIELLLNRIDIVPAELVLAQAANESAWGTSRFARIGLNFFGIWCYQPGCGMVPRQRSAGDKHEVQAFQSVEQAVRQYFYNINTNKAYQHFRVIRADLRHNNMPLTAEILASGLLPYSSRGGDYVAEITQMIRHNRAYFGLENSAP